MRYITLFSLFFLFFACQPATTTETVASDEAVSIDLAANPAWEKDGLRLIPIQANAEFITQNAATADYEVLANAMEMERFRISEKKPYGRFGDAGAVNVLTVQNKTEQDVFLMAGDVIQGGNQDRVVGEDQVIAARSISDIPVFCVEQGRWNYKGDKALNETDRKIFAFRGYYNVASRKVRRSVATGSQQSVWEEVSKITVQHDTESRTKAYAGLESNDEFVQQRTAYERFFSDKLDHNEDIIGFIAVSGDQIIGADVFGHPALLKKQFPALVSSYATDAITIDSQKKVSDNRLTTFSNSLIATVTAQQQVPFVHLAKLDK